MLFTNTLISNSIVIPVENLIERAQKTKLDFRVNKVRIHKINIC